MVNLPIEEVYELYMNGMSLDDLGERFNCSRLTIFNRLHKYSSEKNIPLRGKFPKREMMPSEEIYRLYISGVSFNELSEKYNCSFSTIYLVLRDYCKNNHFKIGRAAPKKIQVTENIVYSLYSSGVSIESIAKKYNCSYRTIYRRLHDYCNNNGIEFAVDNIDNKEIYEKYVGGATYEELASFYNLSFHSVKYRVYSYCEANNIKLKRRPRKRREIPVEEAYNQYKDGETLTNIASCFNCSRPTLRKRINEYCTDTGIEFIPPKKGKLPRDEIFIEYINGVSFKSLAEKYNCSITAIRDALSIGFKKTLLRQLKETIINKETANDNEKNMERKRIK